MRNWQPNSKRGMLNWRPKKQQREDEMKLRMAELEALRHQRDMEVELRKAEAVAINSGLLKSRLIILSRKRAVKLKKNKSSR